MISQKSYLLRVECQQDSKIYVMENNNGAFYVVRKGDAVGIFKSLSDCQAQVGSVCDPPVSVYKGHSLSKDAENHLASQGFKNAAYVISAERMNSDLFGSLTPCPFQEPNGMNVSVCKDLENSARKRKAEDVDLDEFNEQTGPSSTSPVESKRIARVGYAELLPPSTSKCASCVLYFDGASKGNPGKAGAGGILRAEDGSGLWRLREGLGVATNNVAEYRALIMGLKIAIKKGFTKIIARGDSKLVCSQVQGSWQVKHKDMIVLCNEAKGLKKNFTSFEISHIDREFNMEADAQANAAIHLGDGEVKEECVYDKRN